MQGLVCLVCGYVHLQDVVPDKCPICRNASKEFILKEDAFRTKDDVVTVGETEKKHLPVITIENKNCCGDQECKEIRAEIGEIIHPMKPEHFIFKIVFYADKNFIGYTSLTPSLNPIGTICIGNLKYKNISVLAHCNMQGTWMSEI